MNPLARRWRTLAGVLLAASLTATMSVSGPASAAPSAPNPSATVADTPLASSLHCIPAVGGYFCHISMPSTPIRWWVNGTPIPAWDDLPAGSGGCAPGRPVVVEASVGGDLHLTKSFTCLG